jgi:hypothetical protein
MRELKLKPRIQIWVCVNERSHHDLPSCQKSRGEALVVALQQALQRSLPASQRGDVWINRSLCQGSCSSQGVSVVLEASQPLDGGQPWSRRYSGVDPDHAQTIIQALLP